MGKATLVIHGGAGTLLKSEMSAEKEAAYLKALTESLEAGNAILTNGGSALTAVEVAVKSMEEALFLLLMAPTKWMRVL
jgi:beta-aspartyl-peptidase (threonine type)